MMRDIKWALALLLLLLLALLPSIPMALAADPYAGYTRVEITTNGDVLLWNDLKDAISNAQGPTYITIDKNIWLSGDRFSLYFVSGKDIVIDMQGHYLQTLSVDRNTSYSAVFNVEKGAKLKLINGGIRRISYRLDAQAIRNFGDMTLDNWVIDDISSPSSGGAIQNNGTMVIRGGKITNCHARLWSDGSGKQNGGAICNNAGATLTIDGTEIKGNDSQLNGGAIYNEGTLTITGKTNIHENNAGQSGGGIYLADMAGARLYLNGGVIQNNSCGIDGGGVYVPDKASLHVSGNPVVSGNWQNTCAEKAANNLWLTRNALILVDGALTDGAKLSVTASFERGVITKGYGAVNSTDPRTCFDLDRDAPFAILYKNGEVIVDKGAGGVAYIERSWNGASISEETKTTEDGTVCFPNSTTIEPGWYCVTEDVTVNNRVTLKGDTHIVLCDGHTLNVKGLYIPEGSTLHIYGQQENTGKLISKPSGGAGIGGYSEHDNGNIVIQGGTVQANGYDHCAGIGTNDGRTGGSITIYGGTVTANGGSYGAGIGGGRNCSGGTITIYGGTVTAKGGTSDGAAIGGGEKGDGGTITIYGGKVTTSANPNEDGAGIGGGDGGAGGNISIYGGTITTYSRDGAGIGGGDNGDGGNITIYGGTITSTKVNQGQGARIGGGCDAAPGTIVINGGKVTTVGGSGAGIGGGKGNKRGGSVTISGGVINASGSYGIGKGEGGADVAVTLDYNDATRYSLKVAASSFNGTVTLGNTFVRIPESEFEGYDPIFMPGVVTNNSLLTGGELLAWDLSIDYWWELQSVINGAPDGATITVRKDLTASAQDSALYVGSDKNITIDLKGHTLSRGLTTSGPAADGYVLKNEGTLTIVGGVISGGNTRGDAGGVYNAGTLMMMGTMVTENRATGSGGGILNNGTLILNECAIGDNEAVNWHGGGISNNGTLTLNGGSVTGNSAGNQGGGILQNGTMNISGTLVVANNTCPNGPNVYLRSNHPTMKCTGMLNDGAEMHVTSARGQAAITTGYGDWNGMALPHAFFYPDDDQYVIALADDEAWIAAPVTRTIAFDANSGEGEMESAEVADQSEYTLPECGFTAPDGQEFQGWGVNGDILQPGDTIVLAADTQLIALWQPVAEPESEPSEEPAEGPTEEPAEGPTEEPAEKLTEEPAEEPADKSAEEPAVSAEPATEPEAEEEPAVEEEPAGEPDAVEEPAEEPVEEPAEEPAKVPAEESVEEPAGEPTVAAEPEAAEEPAEKPAVVRTITFDGGGAEGSMDPEQAAEGSEYIAPACAYSLEGITFDAWQVESASGAVLTVRAGDTVVVDGDMTFTATWLFDEGAPSDADLGLEYVEEEQANAELPNGGVEIEYDEGPAIEDDQPGEAGSMFNGAGIAGVIAAAVLVIAGAGVAVARKKKK